MIIGNCPVCGAEMRVGTDMTNADRIRSMTDEELAEWIVRRTEGYGFDGYDASVKAWLKWLREEAKE